MKRREFTKNGTTKKEIIGKKIPPERDPKHQGTKVAKLSHFECYSNNPWGNIASNYKLALAHTSPPQQPLVLGYITIYFESNFAMKMQFLYCYFF